MKIYFLLNIVSSLSVNKRWGYGYDDALDFIPNGLTLYQKRFPNMITHNLADLIDYGVVKY